MDGRQKPDPQPENKNDLNDDEIIDLTHVIQDKDNDDIIDLTEVLEQPETPTAPSGDHDSEAAIPLTEVAAADQAPTGSEEEGDGVIGLTGMELPAESDADELAASADQPSAEDEEEIIDLMDVATTLESDISAPEDTVAEPAVDKPVDPDDDEEILDLSKVATVVESETREDDAATADADGGDAAEAVEEDEPIDLLEVVTASESEAPIENGVASDTDGEQEEEAIIDLTDVAAATEPAAADMAAAEASGTGQEDEATTELTEGIADGALPDAYEGDEDTSSTIEVAARPDDDEFADLESRADAILADTVEPLDAPIPAEAAETAGPDANFDLLETNAITEERPAADPVEADAMFAPVPPMEAPDTIAAALTDEQLEAAVRHVVEKVYGDKIEQLMLTTIEKTVKREIEKIKTALLDDGDGFGS